MDDRAVQAWEEAGAIDLQLASPLYGRIPAEIRNLILELALTETVDSAVTASQDWRLKQCHEVDPDSDLEDEESHAEDFTGLEDDDSRAEASHNEATADFQDYSQHADQNEDDQESDEDNYGGSFYSDEWEGYIYSDHIKHLWDRPDAIGPRKASPILRLCRRTYIELSDSKARQNAWSEMRFFGERGPHLQPVHSEARPRRARFYTQMYWLSDTFYSYIRLRVPGTLEKLRDLRLTFRRGDWWNNEDNAGLHVDPFGTSYEGGMENIRLLIRPQIAQPTSSRGHAFLPSDTDAFARKQRDGFDFYNSSSTTVRTGTPMLFPDQSWALAFAQLPSLEKLTIDFETTPDKQEEMDVIVDWAVRDWIFPMYVPWRRDSRLPRLDEQDGGEARERFLSASGSSVHKTSWRGLPQHYSRLCPDRQHISTSKCGYCAVRRRREKKQMGPRLLVWTATWTPRHALEDGTELVLRKIPPAPPRPEPEEPEESDFVRRYYEVMGRDPWLMPPTSRWGFRPRRTAVIPA
ncbi:hypothetical protein PspLS_09310 [Pyricularia sp. CBS 133598]|nr:hypothetical protein PspLS_09310 [Pyricularia sp. CBS 133598]